MTDSTPISLIGINDIIGLSHPIEFIGVTDIIGTSHTVSLIGDSACSHGVATTFRWHLG